MIRGVAVLFTCLTMVEYKVYIDNRKRCFNHVLSRNSIRRYPGYIEPQSLFHQPFWPLHRFSVRFVLRFPLQFVSPVPYRVITGHPSKSSFSTVAPHYPRTR